MNISVCISAVCMMLIIIITLSLCMEAPVPTETPDNYDPGVPVAYEDPYIEQHEFEKHVHVDQPSLFFKAPPGRYIVFDDVNVDCPSGMAAFGNAQSVTYYKSNFELLPLFSEYNKQSEFYVVLPVKKILESITCLNGSINTSASVRVRGRYHYI